MSKGGNWSFSGEIFGRLGVVAVKQHQDTESWGVTIQINENITKHVFATLEDHQLSKYFLKNHWCFRENLQHLSTGDLFCSYII